MSTTMQSPSALTLQFLAWIASGPRSYADVMEAWRSTCPRLSIWEDAIGAGLVQRENGTSMRDSRVVLTKRGRALLGDQFDDEKT